MEFVLIDPRSKHDGGTFTMGSNSALEREKPPHDVTITKPFYLGKYSVTQEQYVAITGKPNPSLFSEQGGRKDKVAGMDTKQFPVEQVSWDDAKACCAQMKKNDNHGRNFRLPTEAEWEYACRAGAATAFYFGDDARKLGDYAWFKGNSDNRTHPVGEKKPNAWGLYDMHGNVFQWCEDYYGPYEGLNGRDPLRSLKHAEDRHVVRGGSWDNHWPGNRAAYRDGILSERRLWHLGFRVAFSPEPDESRSEPLTPTPPGTEKAAGEAAPPEEPAPMDGRTQQVSFRTVDHARIVGTLYPGKRGKQGACVLMLHELGRDRKVKAWEQLAEALQKEGHTVLTFDFRGHGDSKEVLRAFREFQVNRNLPVYRQGKVEDELPQTIDTRDFPPEYMPWMIHDIAAAHMFLDWLHEDEHSPVNTANLMVFGAGSGAALGSLWLASEAIRYDATGTGKDIKLVGLKNRDILRAVWLGIETKWKDHAFPVADWIPWAHRMFPDSMVPMEFMYGAEDAAAAQLVGEVSKGKNGVPKPIPGAHLAGMMLLEKDQGAEKFIRDHLVNVLKGHSYRKWKSRKLESFYSYWKFPTPAGGDFYLARRPDERLLHSVPLQGFGIRLDGLPQQRPIVPDADAAKPPKRKVIRVEEEENPKAKTGPLRPDAPVAGDLRRLAEQATHPGARSLFMQLAIPRDQVVFKRIRGAASGGWLSDPDVEPIPVYLGSNPTRYDKDLTLKPLRGAPAIHPRLESIEHVRPYEEIAREKVREFLKVGYDQKPRNRKEYLSHFDTLVVAEQALSAVLRWHESARQTGQRSGKDWASVEKALRKQLFDEVLLEQMKVLAQAKDWERIRNLTRRLAVIYTQPAERERIFRPVADLIRSALNDSTGSETNKQEALKRLHELETEFPDNPAFRALKK
ncbi:MAG TPA: SUMF1/EgtB/PvdO family nonheme iron enzyme [Gemmataceae bacterium]